jgi:hypothetical protein
MDMTGRRCLFVVGFFFQMYFFFFFFVSPQGTPDELAEVMHHCKCYIQVFGTTEATLCATHECLKPLLEEVRAIQVTGYLPLFHINLNVYQFCYFL